MMATDNATVECALCEGSGYRLGTSGEWAVASRCSCRTPCPDCSDSGFLVVEGEKGQAARPCDCRLLDRKIRLYNEAGIPARFANCCIEDIGDRSKYDLLKHRAACEPGDPGFLLWGEPGVGKTHLVCGLVGYLTLERAFSCRFIDTMRLIRDLKHGLSEGKWDSEVIAPLLDVDVLVIDELGKGRCSDFELAVLDQLISSRYNAGRTIHCTSNYRPEAEGAPSPGPGIEGGFPVLNTLRERVGERIYSRLSEMCHIREVKGEDYRKTAQAKLSRKRRQP